MNLLIALIPAFIAAFFAVWLPGRNARNRFRSEMSRLKSESERVNDADFPVWFVKAQIAVEKECALVQNTISLWHRKRFNAARNKCGEPQSESDIADDAPPYMEHGVVTSPFRKNTYQSGRLRIRGLLDDLITCSS